MCFIKEKQYSELKGYTVVFTWRNTPLLLGSKLWSFSGKLPCIWTSHYICVKEKEYVRLFVCSTQAPELEGGRPYPRVKLQLHSGSPFCLEKRYEIHHQLTFLVNVRKLLPLSKSQLQVSKQEFKKPASVVFLFFLFKLLQRSTASSFKSFHQVVDVPD